MKVLIEQLKAYLAERKWVFHDVHEWAGCTETGFYTEEKFDFDKLLEEIDAFSETFKKGE